MTGLQIDKISSINKMRFAVYRRRVVRQRERDAEEREESVKEKDPSSLSPPPQVMNKGQVKEFDRPYRLLQQPHSLFHRMVQQTGELAAQKLHQMAQEAEMRRRDSRRSSLV